MSIEAMKLALEALEECALIIEWEWGDCRFEEVMRETGEYTRETTPAITALRQAIEQTEQAEPAPMSQPNRLIAYSAADKLRSLGYQWDEKTAAWQAEQAQPVAWRHSDTHCLYETEEEVLLADADSWAEPLYLAPPQRQPLTHPQIHEFDWPDGVQFDDILLFVRAIEQAHGIKGEA